MALRDFHSFGPGNLPPQPAIAEAKPADGDELRYEGNQRLALELAEAKQALVKLLQAQAGGAALLVKLRPDIVQEADFVQLDLDAPFAASEPSPIQLIGICRQLLASRNACDPESQAALHQHCQRLQNARQAMICANAGLVAFVAAKHKSTAIAFEDFLQEGNLGLIRAVDRFDPGRGIRFSTYAVYWIRQAVNRLSIKQEKPVRLSITLAEKASTIFEAMRNAYLRDERWPGESELQRLCDLPAEDVKLVSRYYRATNSLDLDAPLGEDGDLTLLAGLKQTQFPLPLQALTDAGLSRCIEQALASLPEKEAAVLNRRFGLRNHAEMTLQAIADELQITRERVRQIQNQALGKLQRQFGRELQPFLEADEYP